MAALAAFDRATLGADQSDRELPSPVRFTAALISASHAAIAPARLATSGADRKRAANAIVTITESFLFNQAIFC
jgi:hypothetical protein